MSPTRYQPTLQPIDLDLADAFFFARGFGRTELLQFGPQLEQVRRQFVQINERNGAFSQPANVLGEYRQHRKASLLGQILALAKRLRGTVDRAVVLGPPSIIAAARALFAAGGHPHHNELTRGQRGGRPRMYFVPAIPDNDAMQGLLDILPSGRLLHTVDDRWGLIVIDEPDAGGDKPPSLVTGLFHLFWDALQSTCNAHDEMNLAVVVAPETSPMRMLADQIGIPQIAVTNTAVSDPSSSAFCFLPSAFFHTGVLLAASVMGLDIVSLLRGAATASERFATEPPGNNPSLDLGGLVHLLSLRRGIDTYTIEPTFPGLQNLTQTFSHFGQSRENLLIQVLPQSVRTDRLRVTMPAGVDAMNSKKRSESYLPELAEATHRVTREARLAAGLSTAVIRLPSLDELSLGQLIELFSIANSVLDAISAKPPAD